MGLFNRFRRRVKETVDASDAEGMLADEGSEEAEAALREREAVQTQPTSTLPAEAPTPSGDDWEDPEDDEEPGADDGWDEPEDDWELPEEEAPPAPAPKPRRKAPVASKVELRMMRSTTGATGGGRPSAPRLQRRGKLTNPAATFASTSAGVWSMKAGGSSNPARRLTTFSKNLSGLCWNPTFLQTP